MNCIEIQKNYSLGDVVVVKLKDSSTVDGSLDQLARSFVVIKTSDQNVKIDIDNIESIESELWQEAWDQALDNLNLNYIEKIKNSRWNLEKPQVTLSYEYLKNKIIDINALNKTYEEVCTMPLSKQRTTKANSLIGKLLHLQKEYLDKKTISVMLGYISYIAQEESRDLRDCIFYYRQAIICFGYDEFFPQLAMASILSNNNYLAIYSFEKYFSKYSIEINLNYWLVYVYLVSHLGIINSLLEVINNSPEKELKYFFVAAIYMLLEKNDVIGAKKLFLKNQMTQLESEDILQELTTLSNKFNYDKSYDRFLNIIEECIDSGRVHAQIIKSSVVKGFIYQTVMVQNYGFVLGDDWINYHFHRNEMRYTSNEDFETILKHDYNARCLPCEIKTYIKDKGKIMRVYDKKLEISMPKTFNIILTNPKNVFDETYYRKALGLADSGEYHKAINLIRPMLDSAPPELNLQTTFNKWVIASKNKFLPRGINPFAKAERARLAENDIEKAIQLYMEAILKQDNIESSVKNLTSLYYSLNRHLEGVKILKSTTRFIDDRTWFNNVLLQGYIKTEQYTEAIALLNIALTNRNINEKQRGNLLYELGKCFASMKEYGNAVSNYKNALDYLPDNIDIIFNLADTYIYMGNLNSAKALANKLSVYGDDTRSQQLILRIDEHKKDLYSQNNVNRKVQENIVYKTNEILDFMKKNTPLLWEKYETTNKINKKNCSKELAYDLRANLKLTEDSIKRVEQTMQLAHVYAELMDGKNLLESFEQCSRDAIVVAKNIGDSDKQMGFAYETLVINKFSKNAISDNSDLIQVLLIDFFSAAKHFDNIKHISEWTNQIYWIYKNIESQHLKSILCSLVDITDCLQKYYNIDKISDKTQYYHFLLSKIEESSNSLRNVKNKNYRNTLNQMISCWRRLALQESNNLINDPYLEVNFQNNTINKEGKIFIEVHNKGNGIADDIKVTINVHNKVIIDDGALREIKSIRGGDIVPLSFKCIMNECLDFEVEISIEYKDIAGRHHVVSPNSKAVIKLNIEKQNFKRIPDLYSLNAVKSVNQFFGRKKILSNIYENCYFKETNNLLVIHGMRRVGKTSILNYLTNTLEGEVIPVFVDLQGTGSYNSFSTMIYTTFAKSLYEALEENDINIDEPNIQKFKEDPLFEMDNYFDTIKAAAGNKRFIIMLDEFEELLIGINNGRYPQQLLGWLRSKIQHRDELRFIVAGADKVLQMIFDYAQIIYNMSIPIPVSFLRKDETIDLIINPLKGIVKFNDSSIERIFNLTNGHPYYTKILCSQLVKLLNEEIRYNVYLSDVEKVSENIAADTQSPYFKHLWDSLNNVEKVISSLLASRLFHPSDTLSYHELIIMTEKYLEVDKSTFNKAVQNLEYKNLLIDTNNKTVKNDYRFAIDIVRRWIQIHKPVDKIYGGIIYE